MSRLTFYVDGEKVDVYENIDFTGIYRGLETTDTKKNNYSLTVKFPFTYKNDLIFKRTNSLTYKSDFPYDTHECDVVANAVVLISKANLVLLSTTDTYECALTWENFDFIGAILNNPMKVGEFLESFPFIDWNLNHSLMDKTYSTTKADTYGYLLYNDGGGDVGIGSTKYYSYQHPMINFKYLLGLIFDEYGYNLSIPTAKSNFLDKLIIRPNKEYDIYTNNVFEMQVDCFGFVFLYNANAGYLYPVAENTGTSPRTPAIGNNSYYFKTWIDTTDGEDSFFTDFTAIQQIYRFKSFANSTSTLTISDFVLGTDQRSSLRQWSAATETWSTLFTVSGNMSATIIAEEGDWFAFECFIDNDEFKVTITTTLEPIYKGVTNPLYFPAMMHIPTCIDMTVGEYVNHALQLTASELTYDVNSDTYLFSEKTKENGSAYDLTKHITAIKEISYDTKYIYSKLGQLNIFKYLSTSPINADYPITVVNDKLVATKTFIDLLFSTSNTQSGGTYDGTCVAVEHSFDSGQIWTRFTEQPLHLLWNDVAASKVRFTNDLLLSNIFTLFWTAFWTDLEALALAGTVRLLKINTNISDFEFKRVNPKGAVYIKTYGKYYGVIEITKNGDFAEFFLLELY